MKFQTQIEDDAILYKPKSKLKYLILVLSCIALVDYILFS